MPFSLKAKPHQRCTPPYPRQPPPASALSWTFRHLPAMPPFRRPIFPRFAPHSSSPPGPSPTVLFNNDNDFSPPLASRRIVTRSMPKMGHDSCFPFPAPDRDFDTINHPKPSPPTASNAVVDGSGISSNPRISNLPEVSDGSTMESSTSCPAKWSDIPVRNGAVLVNGTYELVVYVAGNPSCLIR